MSDTIKGENHPDNIKSPDTSPWKPNIEPTGDEQDGGEGSYQTPERLQNGTATEPGGDTLAGGQQGDIDPSDLAQVFSEDDQPAGLPGVPNDQPVPTTEIPAVTGDHKPATSEVAEDVT